MKTKPDWQFVSTTVPEQGTKTRLIVRTGIILGIINLFVFIAAPMSRLYLDIPGKIAFHIFFYAIGFGLILAAFGLALILVTAAMRITPGWKGGFLMLLLGLLPVGTVLGYIGPDRYMGLIIHDLSSDTDGRPEFMEAVKLRKTGENSLVYAGKELAAKQHAGYPNIGPIISKLNRDDALTEATQVIKDLSWEFINIDYDKGIIEAYATTPVFGLVDDIIIRVRREGMGSRIDVRSVSRTGYGEPGSNFEHIKQFVGTFRG